MHLKVTALPLIATAVFVFALTAAIGADLPGESSASKRKVVAITQITHDGVSKTNLLSDGSNLYISESASSHRVLAKVSLHTTNRSLISTQFSNVQALDISPDRNKILVSSPQPNTHTNEFWSLPVGSGVPARIGELTGHDAAWSPNGQLIAFSRDSILYTANSDGGSAHKIFEATGSVFASRVSRDGKRIRFTVGNAADGTTSIWEANIDGSNPHALFKSWANASAACCGSWTGDGRYYIFQVTQGTLTTLWAAADGDSNDAAPIQLTTGPTSFGNVSLSQDSQNIWAIGVQPTAQVVSYKATAGALAPVLSGISATDVDFSPDGQWAAYVSIPERELWRCSVDGSEKLKLTSSPESAALPRWSPDSSQIAYAKIMPGQPIQIAIVPVAGGPSQNLLQENRSQIDANWSADGSRIMIGSFAHDKEIDIRLVDLKTHAVETVPGSEGIFSPRWSPDYRYIAALSPDFTKVLLFDYETKKWTTWFAEPAGAVSYPVWSADSKYLYYDDLVTGVESIRQAKLGDSKTESLFTLPSIERYPGPFGLWSGRTPDGRWMFARDRSTQEVYQLTVNLP
jgi:Tol biopolymer transport system component